MPYLLALIRNQPQVVYLPITTKKGCPYGTAKTHFQHTIKSSIGWSKQRFPVNSVLLFQIRRDEIEATDPKQSTRTNSSFSPANGGGWAANKIPLFWTRIGSSYQAIVEILRLGEAYAREEDPTVTGSYNFFTGLSQSSYNW